MVCLSGLTHGIMGMIVQDTICVQGCSVLPQATFVGLCFQKLTKSLAHASVLSWSKLVGYPLLSVAEYSNDLCIC